jgi:Abnormal spindle-like microcephaly-assoc'd, ASPM-SPD-2-Hydin/Beta-propeller repeat
MTSSRPLGRVCGIFVLVVVFVSLLLCAPASAHAEESFATPVSAFTEHGRSENTKRNGESSQSASVLPKSTNNGTSASFRTSQLYFEGNDGQVDREVLYLSRGSRYSIFLTRTGITVVLARSGRDGGALPLGPSYFRLTFEEANSQSKVAGVEQLPGISNYFTGSDPQQWHTRIPQFAKVRYAQLYPGIDLIFYFRDGQLEYDLVASPGANLAAVRFRIEGAAASLTRAGDAAIKIGEHEVVRWTKPRAYQEGINTAVSAHYSLHQSKLSFTADHYDRTQPLVIDPALIFATYLSSNCLACSDQINDIAADKTGVYLTGSTNASSFPATATGPTPTPTSNGQTFVVKLDPTGSHILYSTFLNSSAGQAIAVDELGSVYVSGIASMGSPAFPLTSGVFSGTIPTNPGVLPVGYAAKLSPDGSMILYSTLLQQPTTDGSFVATPYLVSPSKITVDSTGALYVGGITVQDATRLAYQSVWMSLPVTVGAFQTTPGSAFVTKLNPTASGLAYSTYFDGPTSQSNSSTSITGVAVDANGDAFVTGSSNSSGFPTTPGAYQTTLNSDSLGNYSTAYVMKLNPTGTAPVYSTFFGATNSGTASLSYGLALDNKGQAAIAGYLTGLVPVTSNALCGNGANNSETGYVAKFTVDGSALVYVDSLCGHFTEATSVGIDSAGAAYIVGFTDTPSAFQPVLLQPIQGYIPAGNYPNTVANVAVKVDISGNLQWATFLGLNAVGNSAGNTSSKIAVDPAGDAYILAQSNIPPTPDSFGPSSLVPGVPQYAETLDYLLKIAPSLGAPVPLSMLPNQISFGSENVGVASSPTDVQLGNFGDAPMSPVVSTTGDFSETDTCSGSVPGGQKCDINVVFTPTATGNRTGTLTMTFGGNISPQTVALSGVGTSPAVSLSPPALYFGVQAIGTTSGQQQVTLTNTGTGSLAVSSTQTTAQFAATNTCGAAVAPGSNCTIQVTFTPTSTGIQTGTLTINDNASNSPQTVALTGNQTGNAAVTLSPTLLAFAVQNNGTTSPPQTVTVTNSGTAPLVVSSMQTTSPFAATSSCPASVQPGNTCTIQVAFTPSASGTQTGTLTITDNVANSPQTVSLTGNQPAGFSVSAPGGSTSTSASVSAGQTANYNLSVSGTFGFSGAVNFTCLGAPANSKCSVTPNPANISGTSAVALTVSVVTQAASSVLTRRYPLSPFPVPNVLLGRAVAFVMLLSVGFALSAKQRQFSYVAGALALTLLTVVFVGCGGGSGSSSTGPTQPSNPGTATGQYMLTVTGISGSLSQSMNLSLTVK